MNWEALAADPRRIAFARAAVKSSTAAGWNRVALETASAEICGSRDGWLDLFPRGSTEALWFVSEVSDASMALPFASVPAASLAEVIVLRLAQNADLKPFVRQVMRYDFRHGWQALARMQRTARVMLGCAAQGGGWIKLVSLNLVYTYIVFRWLHDRSPGNERTAELTSRLVKRF